MKNILSLEICMMEKIKLNNDGDIFGHAICLRQSEYYRRDVYCL